MAHPQDVVLLLFERGTGLLCAILRVVGQSEMEGGWQQHRSHADTEQRGVNLSRSYYSGASVTIGGSMRASPTGIESLLREPSTAREEAHAENQY